jgi:hypothetical protein
LTEPFDIDAITAQFCRVPGLFRQLDVTITRQDKTGSRGVGSSGHTVTPLVFNNRASDARIALTRAVRAAGMGWMLRPRANVTAQRIHTCVRRRVRTQIEGMAWEPHHIQQVEAAIVEAVEAMDLPPEKGEGPTVRELSVGRNMLAPADELARLIGMYYEEAVSPLTIRKWARAGKIEPTIIDGVQWFRAGDVLTLLRQNKPELTVADRLARLAFTA